MTMTVTERCMERDGGNSREGFFDEMGLRTHIRFGLAWLLPGLTLTYL